MKTLIKTIIWLMGGAFIVFCSYFWEPKIVFKLPQDTPKNTIQDIAKEYVLKYSDDPSSVEFVEWREPVACTMTGWGESCDIAIAVIYRTKNRFGALFIDSYLFYLKDNQVIRVSNYGNTWENQISFKMAMHNIYKDAAPPNPLGDQLKKILEEENSKIK
jgi:hypothetical protein